MFSAFLADKYFRGSCRRCGRPIARGERATMYFPPTGQQIICGGCTINAVFSELQSVVDFLRQANPGDKVFEQEEGEGEGEGEGGSEYEGEGERGSEYEGEGEGGSEYEAQMFRTPNFIASNPQGDPTQTTTEA